VGLNFRPFLGSCGEVFYVQCWEIIALTKQIILFKMTLLITIICLVSWVIVDVRIYVENQLFHFIILLLIAAGNLKCKIFIQREIIK